ncbi:hypothetical protein HYV12_03720 [Candidatus Dojkabacteria bacterium]|nr:hypothetical protein [Candidatus Dojkabacteria bacterium]
MTIPLPKINASTSRKELLGAFHDRDGELYLRYEEELNVLPSLVIKPWVDNGGVRCFPIRHKGEITILVSCIVEIIGDERLYLAERDELKEAFGDKYDSFIDFCSEYELPEWE